MHAHDVPRVKVRGQSCTAGDCSWKSSCTESYSATRVAVVRSRTESVVRGTSSTDDRRMSMTLVERLKGSSSEEVAQSWE